jgi:hypothetical protein
MKTIRKNQMLILTLLLFIAAMMLATPQNCFARPKDCAHRISGRVTKDGSVPERRIDVHLLSEQRKERTERTDNDGYYAFEKVCSGSYRVRPGPAFLENARQPSRYTPSSREVRVPRGDNDFGLANVDFMRTNPPGQGGPRDAGNFIEDRIKIDESVRSGQDMKLAREIEQFLEKTLPCKEHLCDLTIKVSNGRVALTGIIAPEDKPLLNKVRESISGVRRLDLGKVKSKEQP